LKLDFPHLDFDHLDDPWWHHEPAARGLFAIEPYELFQKRVSHFREWLKTHAGQSIAVVGHATFFHALTGQWLQNCEVLPWSPTA
jgi:broad specificity phosphatase PhoE